MDFIYKYNKYKTKYLAKKYAALNFIQYGGLIQKYIFNDHQSKLFSNFSLEEALLIAYLGTSIDDVIREYKSFFPKNNAIYNINLFKELNNRLENSKVIKIANSMWLNENKQIAIDPESTYYKESSKFAKIKTLSFDRIQQTIDKWITNKTEGMITTIPVREDSELIIINAIYFKDRWTTPFNPENTKIEKFNISKKEIILLPFMTQITSCKYYENDTYSVLGKSYENGFTMVFILNKMEHDASEGTTNLCNSKILIQYYEKLSHEKVSIKIPKFTTESTHDLIPILLSANFNNIINGPYDKICNKNMSISQIIQKCKIVVNEEGTEAAAVTLIDMTAMMARPSKEPELKYFIADRPFSYFIIHDDSKTIIFNGVFYG